MESSTFVSAPIKGALKQFKVELRIYLAYTVNHFLAEYLQPAAKMRVEPASPLTVGRNKKYPNLVITPIGFNIELTAG